MALGEALEIADHALRAEVIRVPERATAEWRKAEPEDRADVAAPRAVGDALAQCSRRFVHEAQHEPLQNLRRARTAVGVDAEQAVHAVIDAPLLAALVDVEASARFAAQASCFHQCRNARAWRRHGVLAVRTLPPFADIDRDVEFALIEQ